jgi:hypothetical protein
LIGFVFWFLLTTRVQFSNISLMYNIMMVIEDRSM